MASEVSPYELAVLVLGYLHGRGYSKTAASFKRCAVSEPVVCPALCSHAPFMGT